MCSEDTPQLSDRLPLFGSQMASNPTARPRSRALGQPLPSYLGRPLAGPSHRISCLFPCRLPSPASLHPTLRPSPASLFSVLFLLSTTPPGACLPVRPLLPCGCPRAPSLGKGQLQPWLPFFRPHVPPPASLFCFCCGSWSLRGPGLVCGIDTTSGMFPVDDRTSCLVCFSGPPRLSSWAQ